MSVVQISGGVDDWRAYAFAFKCTMPCVILPFAFSFKVSEQCSDSLSD
jgi:hypothetical protein